MALRESVELRRSEYGPLGQRKRYDQARLNTSLPDVTTDGSDAGP